MALSALILGIVGTVLATLSLGWNIASYFLQAGRVKVEIGVGLMGTHSLISGRAGMTPPFDQVPGGEAVITVEVVNKGRLPVTVTQVAVGFAPNGGAYQATGGDLFPDLPHRLDGGEIATWALPMREALVAGLLLGGPHATMFAKTDTAGSKSSRSKSVNAAALARDFRMSDLLEVEQFGA